MTNWKTYTIVKIPEPMHSRKDNGSFRLDDNVNYSNGSKNFIWCLKQYPYTDFEVGNVIEIDNDITKHYEWQYDFGSTNIVRKASSSAVARRNNDASVNRSSEIVIQTLNRAIDSDTRNKYTASMEVDPKTGSVFYHLTGQRK